MPDLDAIRARADKATQFAEQMRDCGEAAFVTRAPVLTASLMRGGSYTLAEAVEDQAALLAEIDRLREALGQIERADLRQMTHDGLGSYATPPAEQAALMRGLARAALAHPDSSTVGCAP